MNEWIQTYTGKRFLPLNPSVDDVCIQDIAHHLSLKCRFGGACGEFYSVAEHSLRVMQILKPADQIYGLLHDAAEAYLPDLVAPIKENFYVAHPIVSQNLDKMESYAWEIDGECRWSLVKQPNPITRFGYAEEEVLGVILQAFGLKVKDMPSAVWHADRILLATEARDLMGPASESWNLSVPVLPDQIIPWPMVEAESRFLAAFAHLAKGMRELIEAKE